MWHNDNLAAGHDGMKNPVLARPAGHIEPIAAIETSVPILPFRKRRK
jgi:hypothetical protein